MTDKNGLSDELLNAYVDGELDNEDRQRIEAAMRRDDRLHDRIEELKGLKKLVRHAYVDETPAQAPSRPPGIWNTAGLAASVAAFALGVVLTWGWFSYLDGTSGLRVASVSSQDDDGVAKEERAVKVVFHVSENDSRRLNQILNEAETLLATTTRGGRTALVRIIASGAGLSLFEKSSAAESERISAMKQHYRSHLIFNGCGVAYKQLKQRQPDGELELLPEIQLVDLGVLELMRRQRQGWAYIRL